MTALWLGIIVIAGLAGIAAGVWLLVLAFREHLGWGLACCFVPFAALAFALKFWEDAKKPFLYSAAGTVMAVVGVIGYSVTTVNAELGEYTDLGGAMIDDDRPLSAAIDLDTDYGAELPDDDAAADGDFTGIDGEEPLDAPPPKPTQPVIELGEPRSEPTAPAQADTPPDRPRQREKGVVVPVTDLPDMIGELIQVTLVSGERRSVRVEAVEAGSIRVRQRVGGGSVSFTIPIDEIVEIRSRKEP